jgi:hypothetical protein
MRKKAAEKELFGKFSCRMSPVRKVKFLLNLFGKYITLLEGAVPECQILEGLPDV